MARAKENMQFRERLVCRISRVGAHDLVFRHTAHVKVEYDTPTVQEIGQNSQFNVWPLRIPPHLVDESVAVSLRGVLVALLRHQTHLEGKPIVHDLILISIKYLLSKCLQAFINV